MSLSKTTDLTQPVDRIEYIHEAVQDHTEALTTEQMTDFVAKYVPAHSPPIHRLQV